jgi:hypothetical protein
MVTARVEASLRHHTTPLMCHSNHPAWLGNPGSMSHSVLDRDVMPACHRNNRGATTHEPNINPSAGSIALGGACPGEMDAIPVALDSIPRLAPEDVAENVRTRTAAVTSHNCHSRQQNAISARRQLFHIRDSAYRMPGHLGRHAAFAKPAMLGGFPSSIAISGGCVAFAVKNFPQFAEMRNSA